MLMGSLHLMDTAQGSTSGCVQMECVKSVPFQLANCLCISGGASPPNFVGSDYCCESGLSATPWRNALYSNDPLWDGQGCNGLEHKTSRGSAIQVNFCHCYDFHFGN